MLILGSILRSAFWVFEFVCKLLTITLIEKVIGVYRFWSVRVFSNHVGTRAFYPNQFTFAPISISVLICASLSKGLPNPVSAQLIFSYIFLPGFYHVSVSDIVCLWGLGPVFSIWSFFAILLCYQFAFWFLFWFGLLMIEIRNQETLKMTKSF